MHAIRLLLSAGMLACAGTALAQLNFETDATLHDYPSMADGRGKYNPPWCEVGYDSLDLNSVTSYCAIDKSTCGACLNVCGSKGCKYLLAIDRCTRSDGLLDMSTGAGQEVGGATTGHLQVKVTQVDVSKCKHIWNGQMYFSWEAPYAGLATLKSMIDSGPTAANRVVDSTTAPISTSSQSPSTLAASTSSVETSSIGSPSTKAPSTEVSSTAAKPVSESSVTAEIEAASEPSSSTATKASRLGAAHAQPQFTSKYPSPAETKVSSVESAPAKPAVTSEYSSLAETESSSVYSALAKPEATSESAIPAKTESSSTYSIPVNTASPSSSAPKQSAIVPAFTSPTPATTASSSPVEISPTYSVPQQSKTVIPDASMTSEPRSVPTATSFSSSAPFSDSSVIAAASLSAPGAISTNDDSDTKTALGPGPNGAGGRIMIGNEESGSRTVTSLDGESEECVTITSTIPGSVIHYTVTIGSVSEKTISQSPSSITQGVFAETAASDSTRKATTLVRSTSTIWYTQTTISTGCLSGGTECPESLRTTCTSTMLSAVRTYMAVPVYATPSRGGPDNINGMYVVGTPNAGAPAGTYAAGVRERSEILARAPHAKRSAAPASAGSHIWGAIVALGGLIALAVLAL